MKRVAGNNGFVLLTSLFLISVIYMIATFALTSSVVAERGQRQAMTRLRWVGYTRALAGVAEARYRIRNNDRSGLPNGNFDDPTYAPTFYLDLDTDTPHTSLDASDDVKIEVQQRDNNGQRVIKCVGLAS